MLERKSCREANGERAWGILCRLARSVLTRSFPPCTCPPWTCWFEKAPLFPILCPRRRDALARARKLADPTSLHATRVTLALCGLAAMR